MEKDARARRGSSRLIAAATATAAAGGAARAFARFEHVIEEFLRDGGAREGHDRIRQVLPVVRLHPRLDRAAAREGDDSDDEQAAGAHDGSPRNQCVSNSRILSMYRDSSPGL